MYLAKQMQALTIKVMLAPVMYWAVGSFGQMVAPPLNNQGLWIPFPVSLFEAIQANPNLLGCNFYSQSLLVKRVHMLAARYPFKYLLADLLNCISKICELYSQLQNQIQ